MERKEFINKCGACGALSLLGFLGINQTKAQDNSTKKENSDSETMNKTQIRQLFKFIDSSVNEQDKKRIFEELGILCLYSRGYDKYLTSLKNNTDEYFDRVKRGESKYWDKLEYDKKNSVITLVGKKITKCNCEYGQCENPPKALCTSCCVRFQEELFGVLLNRKVHVRLNESFILGSERCSTTIFVE